MNKKKVMALVLCLVLLVSAATACGKEQSSVQPENPGNKQVTLTYTIWDKNQEPVIQSIAREFEKENSNIKINVELTPWKQYWTKLETAATGEVMPDIFWINGPRVTKYVKAGFIEPLDSYISKDSINMENYPKVLIDLYTIDGKVCAMPKDFDMTGLWYNKKIFDEAKVPYPTKEWTWEDLVAAARKLTNKDKGIYGISFTNDNQVGIYNTIAQTGGYAISPDKKKSGYDLPETKKGIQVWVDLIKEGISPSLQEITETPVDDMFQSGKLAMTFSGSWMIKPYMENENVKDIIDLVVMPKIETKAAVIHGIGNAISAGCKNKDAAWAFIRFLSDKKANDMQASSGAAMPAYKASFESWLKAYPNVNLKALSEQVEYSYAYPSSKETAKWNAVEDEYLKLIWAGEMPVDEACNKMAEEMNKILAEE